MKSKVRAFSALAAVAAFLICFSFSRADGSFLVGTAKQDITPTQAMPLWGYSSRHDSLSEGVLDPLYANAIVLQAGGKKIAIVSLDLGRPPTEKMLMNIRLRIKSEAGIENSLIAASHTHHGPVLELSDENGKGRGRFDGALQYYRQLEAALVKVILNADRSLKPARIAIGKASLADFNVNRQSGSIPPPRDQDLSVVRFDDMSGKPIALLVNFAAHPTLVPKPIMKFSADYVGVLKEAVEKATGANILFIQGAAGDQAPNEQKDYRGYGQDLAQEVIKLTATLLPQETIHPSLKVREEQFRFDARVNFQDPSVRRKCEKMFFPELISNYADEYAQGVRPRLTVVVLNESIILVGVAGEFFSSHSIRLKQRAELGPVIFFGYCNGYEQYFPTIEAMAEGGYGTDPLSAPAAAGAGERMMDTALIWIYQMLGKIEGPSH